VCIVHHAYYPQHGHMRRDAESLVRAGYDVTYREYEGRHGVTPAVVREAFEWFLK